MHFVCALQYDLFSLKSFPFWVASAFGAAFDSCVLLLIVFIFINLQNTKKISISFEAMNVVVIGKALSQLYTCLTFYFLFPPPFTVASGCNPGSGLQPSWPGTLEVSTINNKWRLDELKLIVVTNSAFLCLLLFTSTFFSCKLVIHTIQFIPLILYTQNKGRKWKWFSHCHK